MGNVSVSKIYGVEQSGEG